MTALPPGLADTTPDVVIVGAGFARLGMAIALDKADEVEASVTAR